MLIQLSKYTGIPITSSFTHYLDNQSVIRRDRKEVQRKYHIPNTTLSPDWDVIRTLADTNTHLPPNTTKWVKGHQDLKRDHQLLPLPAQLNCEADDEAGQFQLYENDTRPTAPLLPNTHAQLIIDGETVNSYYKTRIREAATLPHYFAYLENKFEWTTHTRTSVDWSTYKQIIRKFKPQHITLVKHLHAIAPTGHIAHRHNHHYPSSCPVCDDPDETNDHVLRCPAITRARWRSTLTSKVAAATNTSSTDPMMSDILRDGITRWLRQLPTLSTAHYPIAYHPLINSQNQIGWDHLFRGRWSTEWSKCHRRFASRMSLAPKFSDGSRWVRILGRLLLKQWFELWTIRNLERHGKDLQEQQHIRREFLQSQLEELYNYRDAMLPVHRQL
jgi:hypothetical protein